MSARTPGHVSRCQKHGCGRNGGEKCPLCARNYCPEHIGPAESLDPFVVVARACLYCVGVGRAKRIERAS